MASSSSSNHAGAIAGGVVGGLAAIAIIIIALFCLRARRKRKTQGGVPVTPEWEKAELPQGAQLHEAPADGEGRGPAKYEAPGERHGDGPATYEMSGAAESNRVHELDAGHRVAEPLQGSPVQWRIVI